MTSCLALGSSLLETYLPTGNRRPSNNREQDFQRNVEDFFRTAACSNYGNEIFNNYRQSSQKQEPFQRDAVEVVFHKSDPTTTVIKTKLENDAKGRQELLKLAENVLTENDNLRKVEEEATEAGARDEDSRVFPS